MTHSLLPSPASLLQLSGRTAARGQGPGARARPHPLQSPPYLPLTSPFSAGSWLLGHSCLSTGGCLHSLSPYRCPDQLLTLWYQAVWGLLRVVGFWWLVCLVGLWAGWALTPEPSSLGLPEPWGASEAWVLPVPHFHATPPRPWHPSPCPGDSALSTVSSMSPESFVSGVVCAPLRARACAGARESCLVSVLCGQMRVGLFLLSLCFSLSFFYSLLILIALCHQPKLSSLRSARRLVLFTSYPPTVRPPMGGSRQSGPVGATSSLGLAPARPACRSGSAVCRLGRQAGRTRGGRACPLHCMFLLLGSLMSLASACPLSRAPLQGCRAGMVHGTQPHFTSVPRPGQLSVPGGVQVWLWEL